MAKQAKAGDTRTRIQWAIDLLTYLVTISSTLQTWVEDKGWSEGSEPKPLVNFDLSGIIPKDATSTQVGLIFYGFKQWLASNWAAFPDDSGKITSATEDYNDLIESGLELSNGESGITYLKVIGKTTAKGQSVKVSKEKLNSQVWSLVELQTLKKAGAITPELSKKLEELEAVAAETKKGKK